MQTNSFEKISPTAFMVAHLRQFTDIPYSKEIAQLIDAENIVEELFDKKVEKPFELAVLIEGRYKAINQLIHEFKPYQIIELASGLLPRGMIMSSNGNITFVESDLPTMISRKEQLVKQLVGKRPNLHFTAIDATSHPSQFPLHVEYLDKQKPVIILCEGLLMYLTFAQKVQVLANIREMLKMYGGVWITSDFITHKYLNGQLRKNIPAFRNIRQTIDNITGMTVANNYFDDLDHAQEFVREQGFCVEVHSMLNIVDKLTCLKLLNISYEVAQSLLLAGSVFVLSINPR
jgi:O-methyltransferase involved in polyketide biosynthesis